jgi:hypothetical protein
MTAADGRTGPPAEGLVMPECFPYTTLVGAPELGYIERPAYKRRPRARPTGQWRVERADTCDHLIGQLAKLADADPPVQLHSHAETRRLARNGHPSMTSPRSTAKTSPTSAPGPLPCGPGTGRPGARSLGWPTQPTSPQSQPSSLPSDQSDDDSRYS